MLLQSPANRWICPCAPGNKSPRLGTGFLSSLPIKSEAATAERRGSQHNIDGREENGGGSYLPRRIRPYLANVITTTSPSEHPALKVSVEQYSRPITMPSASTNTTLLMQLLKYELHLLGHIGLSCKSQS